MVRRALALFFLLLPLLVSAQEQAAPLKVGIMGIPPFLMQKDGVRSGLTIDVWEQVAARNGWSFAYVPYATIEDAVRGLKNSEVDLIAGNISIISQLSSQVDFSQPYFRAGLQIMISDARPHTSRRFIEDLREWDHLRVFWWVIGGVVVFTVLVMLFERRHNPDFPKAWPDSIAEAFYYVITLSLGKSAYKGFGGWFGRLVMIFWTILAVFVVAYVTSSITSVMTLEKLRAHIAGPQDLPGHVVGAVADTVAIPYLQKHGVSFQSFPTLEAAVEALVKGDIPAIVGPAPVLQYFDYSHPSVPITEVGPVFDPYNYGFAFRPGSSLRQPLNNSLLALQESGDLTDIARTYFGMVYEP